MDRLFFYFIIIGMIINQAKADSRFTSVSVMCNGQCRRHNGGSMYTQVRAFFFDKRCFYDECFSFPSAITFFVIFL